MHERVTDPRDLPRLEQRIAEVLPDVAAQVQNERPRHHDGQHDASADGGERLTPGEDPRQWRTIREIRRRRGSTTYCFNATMKDPEFAADVKRNKFDLEPEDGEHLAALINKIYADAEAIIDRVSNLIK